MDNIREAPNRWVIISDILDACKGKVTWYGNNPHPKQIVSTLCKLYQTTYAKKRIKGKLHGCLLNIDLIDKENIHNNRRVDLNWMRLNTPSNIIFTSGEQGFDLMYQTKITIDSNPVLIQAKVLYPEHADWQLFVDGIAVKMLQNGIDPTFDTTLQHFSNIIEIICHVKPCLGVDAGSQQSNDVIQQRKLSVEGKSVKVIVKSRYCYGMIDWTTNTDSCKNCYRHKTLPRKQKPTQTDKQATSTTTDTSEDILLSAQDHNEMKNLLDKIFDGAPPEMKTLLRSQYDAIHTHPNGRRWPREIISTCISLWLRSPGNYDELRDSNMIVLPTGRLLRRYKNCVHQVPGINKKMFDWMYKAAQEQNIPDYGYAGGLIHDETKIQDNLVLQKGKDGDISLIGFVDTGEEGNLLRTLKDGSQKQTLAKEVIQICFQGHSGFRFPLAHYPVNTVKASELYIMLNGVISQLYDYGFKVDYIMMDGGQENRNFMYKIMGGKSSCVCTNTVTGQDIVMCQDFCHNCKKMRNNIIKSFLKDKKGQYKRTLQVDGKKILWKHWKDAAAWDETHSRRIHYRLTKAHLDPTGPQKQRNYLAFDVLDKDMLHLMKCYQNSMDTETGSQLEGTITLLEKTSAMIEIFTDHKPIQHIDDKRFESLEKLNSWFKTWRHKALKATDIFSYQCCDDVEASLSNLQSVANIHLAEFPHGNIIPAMFNSNAIENFFCQQRGMNGNNSNPTYAQYACGTNAVVLGQKLTSRAKKSNAGASKASPYNLYEPEPKRTRHSL